MQEKKRYMQIQIRKGDLVSEKELKSLLENDCKLLTSKQLAEVLRLKSDAALRKQRSKNSSLFPFTRLGRSIYYPIHLVMKTLQKHTVEAKLK